MYTFYNVLIHNIISTGLAPMFKRVSIYTYRIRYT